ncbi:MAG: hypothetical protein O3A51_00940 [Verrucomicrobia bacterium]|nr:hypothetical protein [Verrucomicrobiota bacterium]
MSTLGRQLYQSASVWAFMVTAVRGLGFFFVTAVALRLLPREDMGLWYTMFGIIGMAVMAEFGFNTAIGRFTSYLMGGAETVPAIGLPRAQVGAAPNMAGVQALINMARRLYRILGLLTLLLALIVGAIWLLLNHGNIVLRPMHLNVFLILVVGSGANMTLLFWLGMLYGADRVRLHNQLILAGLLISYVLAFAGLSIGMGLYALALGQVILHLIPRLAARHQLSAMMPRPTPRVVAEPFSWRHVWPMTWRSGLLSLGAYMSLQILTLICSFVTNLETTGSFGLTLQMAIMLHIFSSVWMATQLPKVNALRSQGRNPEVMRIMRRRIPLGIVTYLLGTAFFVIAGPAALDLLGSNTPLLPPLDMLMLFLVVGLDLMVGFHSAVLQAGNEVPHLPVFVVSGVLTVCLGVTLGLLWGVRGVIAAPFVAHLFCNYWYTPRLCWRRLRLTDDGLAADGLDS